MPIIGTFTFIVRREMDRRISSPPRLLEALLDGCYDANLTEKVQVDRDGDG